MAVDTGKIMQVGLELAGWKKMPADSGVHVKGRNINKVLIAIDVGTAELMLARQLGCDAVIAHHPIGIAHVNFYKVFDRHVDFMVEHGVPKKVARQAVEKLKDRVETRNHADIYSDVVGAAIALGMPLVNIHQPCDEYMRQVILQAVKSGKTEYVSDIVMSISRIPEFRRAYRPISRVIVKHSSTVAVSAPLKAIPVPSLERIEGFTTTMYAIVKKVVTPPMACVATSG